MQKALRIESRLEKVDNPADTHLNMCAVLSQLGRHAGALEHAQSALILLQEELFSGTFLVFITEMARKWIFFCLWMN